MHGHGSEHATHDHVEMFVDRRDAGARLAGALQDYAERPDVLVLALPRGGVPVGYEIAKRLLVPLDVLVVRKLGVPGHAELAMGAIASGGVMVLDRHTIRMMKVSADALDVVIETERAELERRELALRGTCPAPDVRSTTVILVDDGLATGSTMLAAIETLRIRRPRVMIVAVPVAPPTTCADLRAHADEMICLITPPRFRAIADWYEDFSQVGDEEARWLLDDAARDLRARGLTTSPGVVTS